MIQCNKTLEYSNKVTEISIILLPTHNLATIHEAV